MTQARPEKGQPKGFRSKRARKLNRNGLYLMVVALVVGGFTGALAFGASGANGLAGPVLQVLLGVVALLGVLALVALVVARRFERADVHLARTLLRRTVKDAYRRAAPRIPVGLVQPVRSAANGDGT